MTSEDIASRVERAVWYQTIELPGGIITPGEYDLRTALQRIPFPTDLTGKRCLDVGVRDGFWAFEMEKRNAAEVVGIDLDDFNDYDWPQPAPEITETGRSDLERRALTFTTAADALGSHVQRVNCSVYDLTPEKVGTFDFAFLGTLLLHLRDPVGALMAVRRVLKGELLLNEPFSIPLTLLRRRKPTAALIRIPAPFWSVVNAAGHVNRLRQAGFEVIQIGRPYLVRYGPTGRRPKSIGRAGSGVGFVDWLAQRRGMPHIWFRARPV